MGLLTMNHQVAGTENSTAVAPETPLPSPSPSSPPIVEIAKITYRDSIIRIYTDSVERVPIRFFHEPIVQVDPKSISADSLGFLQKHIVSFTIEMWNPELRREILTRLQSLNGLSNMTIGELNIHVLPFEKVRLLHSYIDGNVTNPVVKLMDQPKSYFQQSESLRYYLLCDSTETANGIAEEFRQNPRFVLDKWHVTLVGEGLVLGNQVEKGVELKYPVSTYLVPKKQG